MAMDGREGVEQLGGRERGNYNPDITWEKNLFSIKGKIKIKQTSETGINSNPGWPIRK